MLAVVMTMFTYSCKSSRLQTLRLPCMLLLCMHGCCLSPTAIPNEVLDLPHLPRTDDGVPKSVLDKYPNINGVRTAVLNLPAVKEWFGSKRQAKANAAFSLE